MKWLIAIACVPVGGFCVFGVLATFEPGVPNAMAFRIGYLVIGLACMAGIASPFFARKRQ